MYPSVAVPVSHSLDSSTSCLFFSLAPLHLRQSPFFLPHTYNRCKHHPRGTAISGQINSSRRNFYAGPTERDEKRGPWPEMALCRTARNYSRASVHPAISTLSVPLSEVKRVWRCNYFDILSGICSFFEGRNDRLRSRP